MNTHLALEILKHNGLYGLYEPDGCLCAYVSLHGVTVQVSCHKSAHTVYVYGSAMEPDPKGLEAIARWVLTQLDTVQHPGYAAGFKIRFRDPCFDHKCAWCHRPKKDEQEYLCQSCRKDTVAAAAYPWMLDGFMPRGFSKGPVEFADMTGKQDPGYINFLNFPKEGNSYQYRSSNIDGYFADDAKIDFNPRIKAIPLPDWWTPSPVNWRSSDLNWLGAPDPAAAYKGPASMVIATGTYSSIAHLIRTPQNNKCTHVYPPANQRDNHTTFLKPKGPKGDMTVKWDAQLCVKCGNVRDGVWVTVSWEHKA